MFSTIPKTKTQQRAAIVKSLQVPDPDYLTEFAQDEDFTPINTPRLEEYEISPLGEVRNRKTKKIRKSQGTTMGNYKWVRLETSNHYIHILVLHTFIGPKPTLLEIQEGKDNLGIHLIKQGVLGRREVKGVHLDKRKNNNRASNLEWGIPDFKVSTLTSQQLETLSEEALRDLGITTATSPLSTVNKALYEREEAIILRRRQAHQEAQEEQRSLQEQKILKELQASQQDRDHKTFATNDQQIHSALRGIAQKYPKIPS